MRLNSLEEMSKEMRKKLETYNKQLEMEMSHQVLTVVESKFEEALAADKLVTMDDFNPIKELVSKLATELKKELKAAGFKSHHGLETRNLQPRRPC